MNYTEEQRITEMLKPEQIFLEMRDILLTKAVPAASDPERVGVWAMLMLLPYRATQMQEAIAFKYRALGTMTGKKPKYQRNAFNKMARLLADPLAVSAFQSRDEDHDAWGGGVRVPVILDNNHFHLIISVSGMPEEWDETIVLGALARTVQVDRDLLDMILLVSKNEVFKRHFPGVLS